MAVSAYAALLSHADVLNNVQHPARRHPLHLYVDKIQSLQEKVQFLQDFLEVHSQRKSRELEDLAGQIRVVADDVEDIIDLHVVYQLHEGSQNESHHLQATPSSFCEEIDKVITKIDSITKELMMIKEAWSSTDIQEQKPIPSQPAGSSTGLPSTRKDSTMVGFDESLLHIVDELTKDESNLRILPIVGMGGIGKTTLAQNAFNHPYIVDHFDLRIWFTISQKYNVQEILQGLLNDGKIQENSETLAKLGEGFHKKLFGRRYLIVMDDVWNINAWNELSLFFPNNGNRSRIMMTTRMSEVAVLLGCYDPHLMSFLNEEKRWNLFSEKVFGQKGGSYPKLEQIGKDIRKAYRGLPLAIIAIAGLLANSNMQQQYWEFIAKNVNSFANSQDNYHCLKVLFLSYSYLSLHLKACFLYMNAEDYQIKVSELVQIWVAEGFIKPIRGKILEETANGYLEDLVARNLILIGERIVCGKIRSCSIHDLLRDLCLREFDKEHFVRNLKLRLARVMDDFAGDEMLEPTKFRCLFLEGYSYYSFQSSSLHLLWNLKCLLVDFSNSPNTPSVLPNEIWEMPQLRHLKCQNALLPNPTATQCSTILENLHTLSGILNFRCTKEVVERIPNLKKLKVMYYSVDSEYSSIDSEKCSGYCLENLAYLHKLESLTLSIISFTWRWEQLPLYEMFGMGAGDRMYIAFPDSLKKLSFEGGGIPWENAMVIGSLPNLEVPKLLRHAFHGPEWNPEEGQFSRLKALYITESNLVWWRAQSTHFPSLERLFLTYMARLNEVPSEIGDIATLRSIYLERCSKSATISAKQIGVEQHNNGNELEVRAHWSNLPRLQVPLSKSLERKTCNMHGKISLILLSLLLGEKFLEKISLLQSADLNKVCANYCHAPSTEIADLKNDGDGVGQLARRRFTACPLDFSFGFNNVNFSDRILKIEIMEDPPQSRPDRDGVLTHANGREAAQGNEASPSMDHSVVRERIIYFSSLILAAHSPFFYKLFSNGMRESTQQQVTLSVQASDEASLMDMLNFMYSNTLTRTTPRALLDVLVIADKFQVVEFELPHQQSIVYFDLEKEECLRLFPSGQVHSQPFHLGRQQIYLTGQCIIPGQHYFVHSFGLFLFIDGPRSSAACTVVYELASRTKPSEDFVTWWKGAYTFNGGKKTVGHYNMFGVPWTAFVADGSPFFINDILHLRAELTIKTESDEDHLYGELLSILETWMGEEVKLNGCTRLNLFATVNATAVRKHHVHIKGSWFLLLY
ncbi:UNVERIFIED_CONTAM: putative late blight resistance proteinR1A-10 [Sesamum radiatum]|uniref:Late blight resistance proteinR1A-10 n=1 Tax=Sesamum radiatum TaxID=300843 RepID=A0AAW2MDI8_SESRA